jgi:CubicO group peptidase (beta-lactamase class C family)
LTELVRQNFQTSIDAAITRALGENRIVGTVVLIARDGELVYQRTAGFADREAGKDMGAGTLFRLASVTKPSSARPR